MTERTSPVTDELVERAWAAIVGGDIAANCYQANIVRGDLRTALEATLRASQPATPTGGEALVRAASGEAVSALSVMTSGERRVFQEPAIPAPQPARCSAEIEESVVNDLRQWQYDIHVDPTVRRLMGKAADEIERLSAPAKPSADSDTSPLAEEVCATLFDTTHEETWDEAAPECRSIYQEEVAALLQNFDVRRKGRDCAKAGRDVLDFLNSIEGAGYGGMASFEIARAHARDMSYAAQPAPMRVGAPSNDQLSKLWNAIVENTKGDGFWIGEILLTTLEREVGFNPAGLTVTSTTCESLPPEACNGCANTGWCHANNKCYLRGVALSSPHREAP